MQYASKLGIHEYVGIMTALLIISYNKKHFSIPLLSVTIFKDTKLTTLFELVYSQFGNSSSALQATAYFKRLPYHTEETNSSHA